MFCLGAESERSSIENGWNFECLTFGELFSILCFLVCLRLEAESHRKLGVVVGFLMHAAGTWLPTSFPLCFLSKVSLIDVPFLHEYKFLVWRFLIGILGHRNRLGIRLFFTSFVTGRSCTYIFLFQNRSISDPSPSNHRRSHI